MEKKEDRKAMRSPSAGRVYGKHSGFRKLKAYQVAELCYDVTCRFCKRYIPFTTKKLEMNLTNCCPCEHRGTAERLCETFETPSPEALAAGRSRV